MAIAVTKVGHVVLRTTNIESALGFYKDVLGLEDVASTEIDGQRWVFLSAGDSHHDLALVETSGSAPPSGPAGLHHLAFEIEGSLADLARTKSALEDSGIAVHAALDFNVSQGLFVSDPDGNLVELYVNAPGDPWREDPSLITSVQPLSLANR